MTRLLNYTVSFGTVRIGWKWGVQQVCISAAPHGAEETHHLMCGPYWRWVTAARIAAEMTRIHNTAVWSCEESARMARDLAKEVGDGR